MVTLTLYRQRAKRDLGIVRGAAIVGTPIENDQVAIDFEGNVHDAVNLANYRDRVIVAAGRHLSRYPTVARMTVSKFDLEEIGRFDTETSTLTLSPDACANCGEEIRRDAPRGIRYVHVLPDVPCDSPMRQGGLR